MALPPRPATGLLLTGLLLMSALTLSHQKVKKCPQDCISPKDCCPPQTCSGRAWSPGLGYGRYGSCLINVTPCNPPCGSGQWCAEARRQHFQVESVTKKYTCLKHFCLEDSHCVAGSACRQHTTGNCCYPTTCAKKCPVGQRCVKLLRRCPNPGPNPPPCYCSPIYKCTPCQGPSCPGSPPVSRCNPPCGKGERCAEARSDPFQLVPATKKYTCVRDQCLSDGDCSAGSACREHPQGNCCFPTTCAKKCPAGQHCVLGQLPPCANPGPNPPPCYCPPSYSCKPCQGPSCPVPPTPPGSRCDPPCGKGERCAEARSDPFQLVPATKKYTCVRDQCLSDGDCSAGSACRMDPRGNCCHPTTCAKKCADDQRCVAVYPSCPNPGPNPPPCYCPPIYRCSPCQGASCPVPPTPPGPRCDPPCDKGKRCGLASQLFQLEPPKKKYACVWDRCSSDLDCYPGSACRMNPRGNCCYPTTCSKKCAVGQRCVELLRRCANPGPNPPPCYCPPIYRCSTCKGLRCPIG